MIDQQTIACGPRRLNVAAGPESGAPLVLLHGVLRCWQDYVPLIPSLAFRWRTLALDFRGHGRSDRANGAYLVCDYVDDALAVLAEACGEPAVIYGHSLGAMVAAAAAAKAPDKVRALVLEDPPFATMGERIRETPFHRYFCGVHQAIEAGGTVEELAARLAALVVSPPDAKKTVTLGDVRDAASIRFSAKCLSRVDLAVFAPIVESRWLEGYDTEAIAKAIDCPVLLLQADTTAGGMLTDGDAQTFESHCAGCTRIRIPGAGHLLHWEKTDVVLRLTMGFLESLQ